MTTVEQAEVELPQRTAREDLITDLKILMGAIYALMFIAIIFFETQYRGIAMLAIVQLLLHATIITLRQTPGLTVWQRLGEYTAVLPLIVAMVIAFGDSTQAFGAM